jgi:hypothetical protein
LTAWRDKLFFSIYLPPPSTLKEEKDHVIEDQQGEKRFQVWLRGNEPFGWRDDSWVEDSFVLVNGGDNMDVATHGNIDNTSTD